MFECAFLYVAPGCSPDKQNACVKGDEINMNVYGCATYAEAEEVARMLVKEKGCTAIELCAGFGVEGVARFFNKVGSELRFMMSCTGFSKVSDIDDSALVLPG